MGIHVNIGEAKDRLSQLIAAAKRGEEVVIARAGVPEVRLTPVITDSAKLDLAARLAAFHGSFRGKLDMEVDWTAPSMTEDEVREWEEREAEGYAENR
jgi:prevent-host-death family protein